MGAVVTARHRYLFCLDAAEGSLSESITFTMSDELSVLTDIQLLRLPLSCYLFSIFSRRNRFYGSLTCAQMNVIDSWRVFLYRLLSITLMTVKLKFCARV